MLDWDSSLEAALCATLKELGFPNTIYFPHESGVVQFIEENQEVSYTENEADDFDPDLGVEDFLNQEGGNDGFPVTQDEEE